jgi:hypothetical protein
VTEHEQAGFGSLIGVVFMQNRIFSLRLVLAYTQRNAREYIERYTELWKWAPIRFLQKLVLEISYTCKRHSILQLTLPWLLA